MKTDQNAVYFRVALWCFLVAWLAYTLYGTFVHIAAYYVPLPVEDYWRVPENLRHYQALQLGTFWRQHNEHRILFPEIVFALDMLVASGRMVFPIVCSFLCYTIAFVALAWGVANDSETAVSGRWCAILLAAVLTFWQGVALSLAQPFLLNWPLMHFGVALSIFFLNKARDTDRAAYLSAAIGAAVVATYSSANALLLWGLLLAIGFLIRLPKRFLIILGAAAAVCDGLYFWGYQFVGQTNLKALFLHPFYFLGFVGSYLSMPFGGMRSAGFGVKVGLLNLGIVLLLSGMAWRARLIFKSPAVVLLGYYAFTLLTVVITAAGRMDAGDSNFTAAKVPRYLTVPFLNWGAALLLCLWLSGRLQWRIVTTGRLAVIMSVLLLLGTYKLRNWQETYAREFADWQLAALSIDNGLTDAQLEGRIFPSPEFVDAYLPELKEQKLAVFKHQHDKWLGGDLAQFGAVSAEKGEGEITYTYPVEHGLEVVGWVNSYDLRDPFPRIVLANEKGKVVGFGRRPLAGFPADLRTSKTPAQESWVAFVNLSVTESHTISAYAAYRHGLTQIAEAVPVPALQGATPNEAGAPISDVRWNMDKTWTPGIIAFKPRFGWQPPADAYQGTGLITGEFPTPTKGCVILPVLHGPSIAGASAQLIDADSGGVIVDLPLRDHDQFWSLWRVPVTAKRLRFVATDLAIARPMACK